MSIVARTGVLSKPPLADQAYFMMRDRILAGAFPPGAVLSRRRLADEFGMSFLPISEAMQRLETEGLLESRPRVGTRVRTPTPDEVKGRYVVREASRPSRRGCVASGPPSRSASNWGGWPRIWILCMRVRLPESGSRRSRKSSTRTIWASTCESPITPGAPS